MDDIEKRARAYLQPASADSKPKASEDDLAKRAQSYLQPQTQAEQPATAPEVAPAAPSDRVGGGEKNGIPLPSISKEAYDKYRAKEAADASKPKPEAIDAFIATVGGLGTGALDQIINAGQLVNKGMTWGVNKALGTDLKAPEVGNLLTNNLRQQAPNTNDIIDVSSTVGGMVPYAATGSLPAMAAMGGVQGASNAAADPNAGGMDVLKGGAQGTVLGAIGGAVGSEIGSILGGKAKVDANGAVKPTSPDSYQKAGQQLVSEISMPAKGLQDRVKGAVKEGIEEAGAGAKDIMKNRYPALHAQPAPTVNIINEAAQGLSPEAARVFKEAADEMQGLLKPGEAVDTVKGVDLVVRRLSDKIDDVTNINSKNYNSSLGVQLTQLKQGILTKADSMYPEWSLLRRLSGGNADEMDKLMNTPLGKLSEAATSTKRTWAKNIMETGTDEQFTAEMSFIKDPKLKRELASEYIDEGISNLSTKEKGYRGDVLDIVSEVLNTPGKVKRINQLLEGDPTSKAKLEVLQTIWQDMAPKTTYKTTVDKILDHLPSWLKVMRGTEAERFSKKTFAFITNPQMNKSFRAIVNNANGDKKLIAKQTLELIKKGPTKPVRPISVPGAQVGAASSPIIDNYINRINSKEDK